MYVPGEYDHKRAFSLKTRLLVDPGVLRTSFTGIDGHPLAVTESILLTGTQCTEISHPLPVSTHIYIHDTYIPSSVWRDGEATSIKDVLSCTVGAGVITLNLFFPIVNLSDSMVIK